MAKKRPAPSGPEASSSTKISQASRKKRGGGTSSVKRYRPAQSAAQKQEMGFRSENRSKRRAQRMARR